MEIKGGKIINLKTGQNIKLRYKKLKGGIYNRD